jgi:DNA-binding CsgD family transcriptional regulator
MPAELQPASPQPPSSDTASRTLIQRGADLVYLTEELYLRLLVLTLLLTAIGCALSVWFGAIGSHTSLLLTSVIAAITLAFAILGLARPRPCYRWLRHSQLRQLSPAAFAIIAVLCNGPDSPSWWVALPLLWVIAAVSSTTLSVTAATVTAVAYLAGTVLGGEPLMHNGDAEILGAAVALPGNILVGRLVAEVFARFVLRLHQLERQADAPAPPRPVRVTADPGIADGPTMPRPAAPPVTQKRRRSLASLTSRELEALLLVRDGLLQTEIALALGVSTRQVERLLASARSRTGTATTSQLVAKLVTEQLSP